MNQPAARAVDNAPAPSTRENSALWAFVPRVRLYVERLAVDRGDFLRAELHDIDVPVLSVVFDYGGGALFRACPAEVAYTDDVGDEDGFAVGGDSALAVALGVRRDRAGEARAAALLESFGVVELPRLEDFVPSPDSLADYLVHIDSDVHALCSFTAHAVPRLREQGFVVELDEEYPYRVAPPGAPWYASLAEEEGGDWFSLELGVEVDGQRVN